MSLPRLAKNSSRPVSLAAAIIAVLAALGTLFSHHRSISALSAKNAAILAQGRATDAYNAYEARQIRSNIYQALLASDIVKSAQTRDRLQSFADKEQASTPPLLAQARALEEEANRDDARAEGAFKAYETLQLATTIFEISIVFVSISALAATRPMLLLGTGLSAIGFVFFVIGLLQGR